MSTIDELINRVREFATERKWRPAKLATEAGLHANTLRSMWDDGWSPNAATLRKLEEIMLPDNDQEDAA